MDNLLLPADLRKQALVNILDTELSTSIKANTSVDRTIPACRKAINVSGFLEPVNPNASMKGGFPSGAPLHMQMYGSPMACNTNQIFENTARATQGYIDANMVPQQQNGGRVSYGYEYFNDQGCSCSK